MVEKTRAPAGGPSSNGLGRLPPTPHLQESGRELRATEIFPVLVRSEPLFPFERVHDAIRYQDEAAAVSSGDEMVVCAPPGRPGRRAATDSVLGDMCTRARVSRRSLDGREVQILGTRRGRIADLAERDGVLHAEVATVLERLPSPTGALRLRRQLRQLQRGDSPIGAFLASLDPGDPDIARLIFMVCAALRNVDERITPAFASASLRELGLLLERVFREHEAGRRERAAERARREAPAVDTGAGPASAEAVQQPDEDDLEGRIAVATNLTPAARSAAMAALQRSDGSRSERRGEETARLILDLGWVAPPRPPIDLGVARQLIASAMYGQERAKEAVVEHLALEAWRRSRVPPIDSEQGLHLLLSGDPGVGKTAFARGIAAACGLVLIRIALGGATSVSLAGSDQSFAFAQPGEIVRQLRASHQHPSACLILLDEMDHTAAGAWQPEGTLLQLLDPLQNCEFHDYFLPLPIDLSGALFVATANSPGLILPAIRDRMRTITFEAYTQEEQIAIGVEFRLPALRERLHLGAEVTVTDDAVRELVEHHPKVPGMRQLDRLLTRVVGRAIQEHLETGAPVVVNAATARRWTAGDDAERAGSSIGFRSARKA